MAANRDSLLAGRNTRPLTEQDIVRVTNTFLGFDAKVPVRHEEGARTRFRVVPENGTEVQEIVFGADIYPGTGVVDPNSSLSMQAAVAHEICHFYRWRDKTELEGDELALIDEALTDLQAINAFPTLTPNEVRQLASDAVQRLQMYMHSLS